MTHLSIDTDKKQAALFLEYVKTLPFVTIHPQTNAHIEFENELYPFRPGAVSYDDKIILLKKKLECEVAYKEPYFYINYKPLDISVWGNNRDGAEDAFNFSFFALYENYVLENNANLSAKAIELKKRLKKLIKKVINES